MHTLLLLIAATLGNSAQPTSSALPNPTLTPGHLREVPATFACGRPRPDPAVDAGLERQVKQRYQVQGKNDSVDLLIPAALGGTLDVRNLWPQPRGSQEYDAKNRLEVRLVELVCAQAISLQMAQSALRNDWRQAYARYVPRGVATGPPKSYPGLFINGDGMCPNVRPVSGSYQRTYYLLDHPRYHQISALQCFKTAADAQGAGYRPAPR